MGRRLGQHFLIRQSALGQIAAAVCEDNTGLVVEIGAGRGALTSHLLARANRVAAIEVDPVLVHFLRGKFQGDPRLEIIENDILNTDLAAFGPLSLAGNLPYYITSPILDKALALGPLLTRAVFLVQAEVAQRLIARPGSRDYGFLSVHTQLLAHVDLLFTVPRSAFRPPPKVDSAVVRLVPRQATIVDDPAAFLKFAGLCFRHKRKTLRNNLLAAYPKDRIDTLPDAGKRAEQLSIEQLAGLFALLRSHRAASDSL